MTSTMRPVVSPEHVPDRNGIVRAKTYKTMVGLSEGVPLVTYHNSLEKYSVCLTPSQVLPFARLLRASLAIKNKHPRSWISWI